MNLRVSTLSGIVLLTLLATTGVNAQEWQMIQDFRGQWKFELGDDMKWADPKFDDTGWENMFVPSPWEDEGYPGYDGYAWYRKHLTISPDLRSKQLYINLGVIDDVDEAYINGRFIGFEGSFPPHYITAYSAQRIYQIPGEYLNYDGDNVIAVRVYDSELSGGILHGKPGLYEMKGYLYPDVSFAGIWKFKAGDSMLWKDEGVRDADWKDVHVPAYWETQGMKGYDGYGWYRRSVRIPTTLADETLILMLGRIDDIDETYFNGERIGRTGRMNHPPRDFGNTDEYRKMRAYTIPPGLIKFGQENTIAVRVYDGFLHGGIYDGPIGIVTRTRYLAWQETQGKKKGWNIFDLLWK
jgi:Beta-galactosidase second all-beta domain